jgi:hypothetical protein
MRSTRPEQLSTSDAADWLERRLVLTSRLVARFLGCVTWFLADHGNPSPSVRCSLPTIRELGDENGVCGDLSRIRAACAPKGCATRQTLPVHMTPDPGNRTTLRFYDRASETQFRQLTRVPNMPLPRWFHRRRAEMMETGVAIRLQSAHEVLQMLPGWRHTEQVRLCRPRFIIASALRTCFML